MTAQERHDLIESTRCVLAESRDPLSLSVLSISLSVLSLLLPVPYLDLYLLWGALSCLGMAVTSVWQRTYLCGPKGGAA